MNEDAERSRLAAEIGSRLVEVREMARLTQRELSELTGIKVGTLSRYENGKMLMTVEAAHKIAKATRSMAGYILTGETGEPQEEASPPGYDEFVEAFGSHFDEELVQRLKGDVAGRFGLRPEDMTAKRYLELAQLLERARGK